MKNNQSEYLNLKVEILKMDTVVPYKNSLKEHTKEQISQLKSSIIEFGFNDPIAVDQDNTIIEGYGRYLAMKELGKIEIPAIRLEHLNEEQKRKYIIAHNKITLNTGFNLDALKIELSDLKLEEEDFESIGFSLDELSELDLSFESCEFKDFEEQDIPEIDEVNPPFSQKGDIWLLGNHRLMCGDSTLSGDVKQLMDGEQADMVFTDPPWNVNYGTAKEGNPQGYKQRSILNDSMGTGEFKEFMSKIFSRMAESSKKGCPTYVVMSAQEWGNLMLTLKDNNYHWSSTIIWNKDSLVLSRKDYHTRYEPIWYGWLEGAPRLQNVEDRTQCDVWDIPRPKVSELHPTTKPLEVPGRAVLNSSKKGNIILDLFGGSGSTLIACENHSRVCRTMELDERYCDVIVKRYFGLGKKDISLVREGKIIEFHEIELLKEVEVMK